MSAANKAPASLGYDTLTQRGLAEWCEKNGASIEISHIGRWVVRIGWCQLKSYSDDSGTHKETWEISRHGFDLADTLRAALDAVIQRQGGKL